LVQLASVAGCRIDLISDGFGASEEVPPAGWLRSRLVEAGAQFRDEDIVTGVFVRVAEGFAQHVAEAVGCFGGGAVRLALIVEFVAELLELSVRG